MTNVATMWQLQSTVLILLSASVASMACLPDGAGDAIHNDLGAGMVRYQAEQLQISFAYPDSLLAGRFREAPLPQVAIDQGMEPPFRNAVVLIQRGVLGDHDLEAIPVGELPVIWIDRSIAASGAEILAPDGEDRSPGADVWAHTFCPDRVRRQLRPHQDGFGTGYHRRGQLRHHSRGVRRRDPGPGLIPGSPGEYPAVTR